MRRSLGKSVKIFFTFNLSHISSSRPSNDYTKIQLLYGFLIRNKKIQLCKSSLKHQSYLNIGCGPYVNKNFINLDSRWRRGIDVCWDIRKKLPFPDGSMQGIFTEHCLEHLFVDECRQVLRECCRILKDKGTLRVVVPDLELYLGVYNKRKQGECALFPYADDKDRRTPAECINSIFFDFEHRFLYDAETLTHLLAETGFSDIRREGFRHGRDAALLIDLESRSCESLYMEASVSK